MDIKEAMLNWLHSEGYTNALEVLSYEEEERYGVVCGEGTCWEDYTVVVINFRTETGQDYDWYEGELTQFIRELTDAH